MATRLKRRSPTRTYRKTIWIVCNGYTEKCYFSDFLYDLGLSSIKIKSSGCNRLSLVKDTKKSGLRSTTNTEVWIVFDVDDDPTGQTNTAIVKCRKHGFKPIVSNECFEIWFRLHFDYINSPLPRSTLFTWMSKHFQPDYENNKRIHIYAELKDKIADAIRNSKRLAAVYDDSVPFSRRNPYTNVYELVEALNAYAIEGARNEKERS